MFTRDLSRQDLRAAGIDVRKHAIAWNRLCNTLKVFGQQNDRFLLVTTCSDARLELRYERSDRLVTLTFQGESIAREMGDLHDFIHFVKIRRNGIAYRMGGVVHTATRLVLALLSQCQPYYCVCANMVKAAPGSEPATRNTDVVKDQATREEIVLVLRETALEMAAGVSLEDICNRLGISEALFHRWHSEYRGLDIQHARVMTRMEEEIRRLRRQIARLTLLTQPLMGGYPFPGIAADPNWGEKGLEGDKGRCCSSTSVGNVRYGEW